MGAISNVLVVSLAVFLICKKVEAMDGLNDIYESLEDLYNLHPKPSMDEVIALINKVSSQVDSVSKQVAIYTIVR